MSTKSKSVLKVIFYLGIYLFCNVIAGVILGVKISADIISMNIQDSDVLIDVFSELLLESIVPTIAISQIVFIIVIYLIIKIRKKTLNSALHYKKWPTGYSYSILFSSAFAFNFMVSGVLGLLNYNQNVSNQDLSLVFSQENEIGLLIILLIGAPVIEEILLRGLIYTRLKPAFTITTATFVSSLIFGLLHGELVWSIYTFAVGIYLCFIYEKYGTLKAAIIYHFAFNLAGVIWYQLTLIPFLEYILPYVSILVFVLAHRYFSTINTIGLEIRIKSVDENLEHE